MANTAKTYLVEDADEGAKSGIPPGVFPGTLAGSPAALDTARYRSAAAGTGMLLALVGGEQGKVIRKFEGGTESGLRPERRFADKVILATKTVVSGAATAPGSTWSTTRERSCERPVTLTG